VTSDRVIVIGAGPAGLAAAATLQEQGVPCTLLERASSVGAAWQGRYDSLRLHTVRWLSGLPGAPIPRRYGRWVARDDLVAYLHDYAEQNDLRPELGVEVMRIDRDRDGAGWRVETSEGARAAGAVVVATGYSRTPYLPDWPGRDSFPGSVMHSADYREPSSYAGQRVLVVGAGNSAAEIAVDLVGAGAQVELSVRTPPNIVRRDTLGVPSQLLGIALKRAPERLMNPLSRLLRRISVPDLSERGLPAPPGDGFTQFLRTRTVPILDHGFVSLVRSGAITVVPAVEAFDDGAVRLADGSLRRPDAIIAATGYRPDLEAMVGHLDVLDDRGVPRVHGAQTLPQAPGLYFVGIKVELAGLIREIALEARAVARGELAPQPVSR
jgi:cation diffusion facilitator CzcD-associated flavoprotein CzcO